MYGISAIRAVLEFITTNIFRPLLTIEFGFGFCSVIVPGASSPMYTESSIMTLRSAFLRYSLIVCMLCPRRSGTGYPCPFRVNVFSVSHSIDISTTVRHSASTVFRSRKCDDILFSIFFILCVMDVFLVFAVVLGGAGFLGVVGFVAALLGRLAAVGFAPAAAGRLVAVGFAPAAAGRLVAVGFAPAVVGLPVVFCVGLFSGFCSISL